MQICCYLFLIFIFRIVFNVFILFQSSLETKEYMVHELPKVLDVPQDRLCLMAALLGGTILSENSLTDFYKRIGITQKKVVITLFVIEYQYSSLSWLPIETHIIFSHKPKMHNAIIIVWTKPVRHSHSKA